MNVNHTHADSHSSCLLYFTRSLVFVLIRLADASGWFAPLDPVWRRSRALRRVTLERAECERVVCVSVTRVLTCSCVCLLKISVFSCWLSGSRSRWRRHKDSLTQFRGSPARGARGRALHCTRSFKGDMTWKTKFAFIFWHIRGLCTSCKFNSLKHPPRPSSSSFRCINYRHLQVRSTSQNQNKPLNSLYFII